MRTFGLLMLGLAIAGCSVQDVPAVPVVPPTIDSNVLVADADPLVVDALEGYVDLTNDILSGRRQPVDIGDVATAEWTVDEIAGFSAVRALGGTPTALELAKWQVANIRGRHILVDAIVAACLGNDGAFTRVTVRLVPRQGSLVIAEIVPSEDSAWCVDSPLL